MAGQQFQYDDSGNTFFYFLTSFVGLIVIPATYYFWPRDQNAEQLRLKSLRRVHGRCLWYRLRLMKSQQSIVPTLKKAALLFGWVVFLFLAYKVSKLDREYQEYNPYEVLNLEAVLLVYGLAFMVIFPVVVGTWWYRSIRYSGDQILINTKQLFMHFMYKMPTMNMKRLVMVLTAAFEFDPRSNKEAIIRPTDNIEVPQLIRELGNINVKKKEPPFCYPYSLKARVLLLAHLARMDVSENIEEDQSFVMKKCPALLQEIINVGCQLTMMATSRGGLRAPRLTSIENCMKLSQMVVQGLQEAKSPLLQLPHLEEEHLRYCISKKYKVRTLQDLVSLKDSDRRNMLRFLGEEKYDEVLAVLGSFPCINMETKLQVLDDEDSNNITAGSIVTVTVTLTRKRMSEMFEKEEDASLPTEETNAEEDVAAASKAEEDELSDKGSESDEAEGNKDSPSERDEESDKQSDTEEWEALQQSIQRRKKALLETKSKSTHPVYSLYFPEEKQEWWWLYIADRKEQTLVSMPNHVCTLRDTEEVELKFPAPSRTGNYQYSVILRSDSFMGLDQIKPLKLEVHEAKAIVDNHPQWDIPETEEEEDDQEDSDGIEESEEDDDND